MFRELDQALALQSMGSTLKGIISLLMNKICILNFLNEFRELFNQDRYTFLHMIVVRPPPSRQTRAKRALCFFSAYCSTRPLPPCNGLTEIREGHPICSRMHTAALTMEPYVLSKTSTQPLKK